MTDNPHYISFDPPIPKGVTCCKSIITTISYQTRPLVHRQCVLRVSLVEAISGNVVENGLSRHTKGPLATTLSFMGDEDYPPYKWHTQLVVRCSSVMVPMPADQMKDDPLPEMKGLVLSDVPPLPQQGLL